MRRITRIDPRLSADADRPPFGDEGDVMVRPRQETRTKPPPFYRIILLNDDFTPMDFVVGVLRSIFHKSSEEATEIMLRVHHNGSAVCGTFTREVAETKAQQLITCARRNSHPLRCRVEEA